MVRSLPDDALLPKTATKRKYYGRCAVQRSAINFAYSTIVRAGGNGRYNAGTGTRNTTKNNNSITITSRGNNNLCASGLLSVAFQLNGRREFSCTRGIIYKRAPPVAFQLNGRRGSLIILFHKFNHTNINSDRKLVCSCRSLETSDHHRARYLWWRCVHLLPRAICTGIVDVNEAI